MTQLEGCGRASCADAVDALHVASSLRPATPATLATDALGLWQALLSVERLAPSAAAESAVSPWLLAAAVAASAATVGSARRPARKTLSNQKKLVVWGAGFVLISPLSSRSLTRLARGHHYYARPDAWTRRAHSRAQKWARLRRKNPPTPIVKRLDQALAACANRNASTLGTYRGGGRRRAKGAARRRAVTHASDARPTRRRRRRRHGARLDASGSVPCPASTPRRITSGSLARAERPQVLFVTAAASRRSASAAGAPGLVRCKCFAACRPSLPEHADRRLRARAGHRPRSTGRFATTPAARPTSICSLGDGELVVGRYGGARNRGAVMPRARRPRTRRRPTARVLCLGPAAARCVAPARGPRPCARSRAQVGPRLMPAEAARAS